MNRNEAILKELEGRRNHGRGIENFRAYLHSIGDPQRQLRCVHVAGTNGKGSTVNFIRSILQEAHYRIGTFTSPYLETHYDRIRINNINIDADAFITYYDRYHEGWYAYDLSSFEIDTVIAFLYFADQKVDLSVIEAGIGGRFDCTNVIQPLCSVITNIGLDHMDCLGDHVEAIAWQKGGIIKPGIPLVTAEKRHSCLKVFEEICMQKQASLIRIKSINAIAKQGDELCFEYDDLPLRLTNTAFYQIENSACALEACRILRDHYGMTLKHEQIHAGIAKAHWQGRFETVWKEPLIILDGAHNEAGIRALCDSLCDIDKGKILFAACKDKDTDTMLRYLCKTHHDIYVTEFAYFRSQEPFQWADHFPVQAVKDYRKVIHEALNDPIHPLIITGSLYFISEVRAYFKQLKQDYRMK